MGDLTCTKPRLGANRSLARYSPRPVVRHAQRAADFLTWHERPCMVHAIASSDHAAQTIIKQTWACDPTILVMGVYGHGRISDYLFGSVTRTLLKESPLPLFLFH